MGVAMTRPVSVAQELANLGWTVVGAWKNPNTAESGHLATVRPGNYNFQDAEGPLLANVGIEIGERYTYDGFEGKPMTDIKFYYDPYQSFIYDELKIVCTKYKELP
jgi:hypothetical protein